MSFSKIAVQIMNARMKDHKNKVGSQLKLSEPALYKGYESTDCITFVLNVLKEAFVKQGNKSIAENIFKYGMASRGGGQGEKFYGDLLAKALVNKHMWSGIYLSPDKFHPTDGDQEHTYATTQAIRTCQYAGVPVSYLAIDYSPLSKTDVNFQALYPYKERKLNTISLKGLKNIEFGFGISRGGMHTWLFSKGFV